MNQKNVKNVKNVKYVKYVKHVNQKYVDHKYGDLIRKMAVAGLAYMTLLILTVFLAVPVSAATRKVTSLSQLKTAIAEAGKGDVIEIGKTIWVKSTIVVEYDRVFTLKGGTLKRSAGFTGVMMHFAGKPLDGDYVVSLDPSEARVTFDGVIFDGNRKNVPDSDEMLYFYNGARVKFKNCTLKNNGGSGISSGSSWGHGISYVPTTIIGSKFVNNSGTAISYYGATDGRDGELTISNTVISGNGGSGIRSNNGFTLKNVEIRNNGGDGIYCGCGGEHFTIIGGKISGNGEYGIDVRSCEMLLKGGVKITGNKLSGVFDGNSFVSQDSVVTLGDVQISGNKEFGICAYNKIVLRGTTGIADPIQLKYSTNGHDWGQIRVESKVKNSGRVAEIVTDNISIGSDCIYISNSSYAKLSQFKCSDPEKCFRMGADHWAALAYGEDESMPGTPVLTAKKGKTNASKLSWKAAADADGYEIRVSLNGGKFKKLDTVAGTVKKYTSKGLKKGASYSYKIRAFRRISGKLIYGAYSEVQKVKI